MRSRILARALLCTTLLVGTTTGIAFAEPSAADIAQAREIGQQAIAAFEAANYAEAEKLFLSAQNLFPAPTLTLGLARAQVKLGKLVAAQESYNKIVREQSQNANLPPAFKDALDSAKSEVGPVSAKIANVVIRVDGAPNPTVTLDGQPVSSAGLGLKRPVDPGSHAVHAEAPGFKPADASFQVAEAGAAELNLKLEKPGPGDGVAGAQPGTGGSVPEQAGPSSGNNKTLAYAAFGVGGAGIVLGGVTGLIAVSKHGKLADACTNGKCPSNQAAAIRSYKTMGTLSTVGFIVGVLGAGTGAVLWFTSGKEDSKASATFGKRNDFEWHPYVTESGGGFTGTF